MQEGHLCVGDLVSFYPGCSHSIRLRSFRTYNISDRPMHRFENYWPFVEKTSVKQSMKRKVCSNFQMSFLHVSYRPPSRGIS